MKELVEFEEKQVLKAFFEDGGLDPIISDVKSLVDGFEHDMKNATSRAKTASLSHRISKLKVKLDDMGKDLISDWKAKAKVVDASRKTMRDTLDSLRDEARLPLTEWEADEARKAEEKAAQEAAEKLKAQIEQDHEVGLLMNEAIDREIADALQKKLDEEKAAREEELRLEAARKKEQEEVAKKAEEERIEREKQFKIEQEEAAKRHEEELERQKIAAEERLKLEKEAEEKRIIEARKQAEIEAKEAAEKARLAEIKRQEDEAEQARIAQEKREANNKYVGGIRRKAKEALMVLDLDEATAKKIVLAIDAGDIPNVYIKY